MFYNYILYILSSC